MSSGPIGWWVPGWSGRGGGAGRSVVNQFRMITGVAVPAVVGRI